MVSHQFVSGKLLFSQSSSLSTNGQNAMRSTFLTALDSFPVVPKNFGNFANCCVCFLISSSISYLENEAKKILVKFPEHSMENKGIMIKGVEELGSGDGEKSEPRGLVGGISRTIAYL